MASVDAFDDLLAANADYAAGVRDVAPTGTAQKALAIVTCIDSRIDPLAVFGLQPGDAKILRNAGARVTPDVERGLALSTATLGVDRIAVVQHTECAVASNTADDLAGAVSSATGRDVHGFDPLAIDDQAQVLQGDVDRLLDSALLPDGTIVAGMLLHLREGRLEVVVPPRAR